MPEWDAFEEDRELVLEKLKEGFMDHLEVVSRVVETQFFHLFLGSPQGSTSVPPGFEWPRALVAPRQAQPVSGPLRGRAALRPFPQCLIHSV